MSTQFNSASTLREVAEYILEVLVLVSLMGGLVFLTRTMKAPKGSAERKTQASRVWIFLGIYAVLNIVRLMMQQGIF